MEKEKKSGFHSIFPGISGHTVEKWPCLGLLGGSSQSKLYLEPKMHLQGQNTQTGILGFCPHNLKHTRWYQWPYSGKMALLWAYMAASPQSYLILEHARAETHTSGFLAFFLQFLVFLAEKWLTPGEKWRVQWPYRGKNRPVWACVAAWGPQLYGIVLRLVEKCLCRVNTNRTQWENTFLFLCCFGRFVPNLITGCCQPPLETRVD